MITCNWHGYLTEKTRSTSIDVRPADGIRPADRHAVTIAFGTGEIYLYLTREQAETIQAGITKVLAAQPAEVAA